MTTMPTPTPQPSGLLDAKGGLTQTGYRHIESLGKSARSAAEAIAAMATETTAAQYRSDADANLFLSPRRVWDASEVVALTDAATITVDLATGFHFSVSLSGNRTLGNPSNAKPGQAGCFAVTASGGTRALSKSSNYKSTSDITFPISIASGQTAYVFYYVYSSSIILVTGLLNNPT